jgi:hypothetical protein
MANTSPKREALIDLAREARNRSLAPLIPHLGTLASSQEGKFRPLFFYGLSVPKAEQDKLEPTLDIQRGAGVDAFEEELQEYLLRRDRNAVVALLTERPVQEAPRELIAVTNTAILLRPATQEEREARGGLATGGAAELLIQEKNNPAIFRLSGVAIAYSGLVGDSFAPVNAVKQSFTAGV